jgi:predicted RNA binding protein YcfA (HicA-like mRNA interferase family)
LQPRGFAVVLIQKPKDGAMKVRDMLRLLREDRWYLVRTTGSHRQFHHPFKPGTVTVAGHPGGDLHTDTVKSILRQAGLGK